MPDDDAPAPPPSDPEPAPPPVPDVSFSTEIREGGERHEHQAILRPPETK